MVTVRQLGRWRYQLTLYPTGRAWGLVGYEGPRVWGRKRADRKAQRVLRKLQRDDQ